MKNIEFFLKDTFTKETPRKGGWIVYSSQMVGAFNSTKMPLPHVKAHVWAINNVFNEGDAETILQNNIVKVAEYAWNGPSKDDSTIFATAIIHSWDQSTNVLRVSFMATDTHPNIACVKKVSDIRDIKPLSS